MVNRLDTRDRLHFIAEAGVKKCILQLKKQDATSDFDALKESWSNNAGAFKQIQVGSGNFTVGYVYRNRKTGILEYKYGMIDEERKININKAERSVIERLFKAIGLDEMEAQNLSAAIVDWRDSDSELSIPLGSAEGGYYRNLRNPYDAKDADFEVLDELFLVRGMTRDIFDRIKDFITIYGDGKVNINTASFEVLISLGLHKSIVDKILSFRNGEDFLEATADDNVFEETANIVSQLSQFYSLSAAEVANLSNLVSAEKLDTKSTHFMIKSTGVIDNKKASLQIVCIFERSVDDSDETGKIRYWREKPN
jgi:type II secretory pathway component PulK